MNSRRFCNIVVIGFVLIVAATHKSSAQTISATDFDSGTGGITFDLTAHGTTDWVHFGVSGSMSAFTDTNEKSGGSVGGLDTVNGVTVTNDSLGGRTQNTSNLAVSYTNGTSPASSSSGVSTFGGTAANYSIQTNYDGTGNTTLTDPGLTFTIDFNHAISSGDIYLAANTYQDASEFTASLSGGPSITPVDTAFVNGNFNEIFDVHVTDIAAGTTLTLGWSSPGTSNGFDNLSLSGVALDLTEAPEPSTYVLMALGLVSLLGFGQFRRLRA